MRSFVLLLEWFRWSAWSLFNHDLALLSQAGGMSNANASGGLTRADLSLMLLVGAHFSTWLALPCLLC